MTQQKIKKARKIAEYCMASGHEIENDEFQNFMGEFGVLQGVEEKLALFMEALKEKSRKRFRIMEIEMASFNVEELLARGKGTPGRKPKA